MLLYFRLPRRICRLLSSWSTRSFLDTSPNQFSPTSINSLVQHIMAEFPSAAGQSTHYGVPDDASNPASLLNYSWRILTPTVVSRDDENSPMHPVLPKDDLKYLSSFAFSNTSRTPHNVDRDSTVAVIEPHLAHHPQNLLPNTHDRTNKVEGRFRRFSRASVRWRCKRKPNVCRSIPVTVQALMQLQEPLEVFLFFNYGISFSWSGHFNTGGQCGHPE